MEFVETDEHNIIGKSPYGLCMRKSCLAVLGFSQWVSEHMQRREPALQRCSERALITDLTKSTRGYHERPVGIFHSDVLLHAPQKGGGKGRWQDRLVMEVTHDEDAAVTEGFRG